MKRAAVIVLLSWRYLVTNVAGFVLLLSVALVGAWLLCGCTPTAKQEALAVVTEAANAAVPTLRAQKHAEETACLTVADRAQACVDGVRQRYGAAVAALHSLAALDAAAIDDSIDIAEAVAAYCALTDVLPDLPPLPAVLGGCP